MSSYFSKNASHFRFCPDKGSPSVAPMAVTFWLQSVVVLVRIITAENDDKLLDFHKIYLDGPHFIF